MKLKIATRESPLALWQAKHVAKLLKKQNPDCNIELIGMKTIADKFLESSLQKIGGKGLFVKELETALLTGDCDLAIHSMKDVPVELPPGLKISTVLKRADPRDCFVSNRSFEALPKKAIVGTSSLRRAFQILLMRPDLTIKPIRGNVQTRLAKLASGEFDVLLLAAAGLQRLEMQDKIKQYFETDQMLPAVAQGVLGIETRENISSELETMLHALHDDESAICIEAERNVTRALGGNCHLPIASYATIESEQLILEARVGSIAPIEVLHFKQSTSITEPETLGQSVAENLLAQGAQALIDRAHI